MKRSFIYDQGSSEHYEDGIIISPPFFGVLDGVSGPYSPNHPPRIFNGGMSGGELVSRVVEKQFARFSRLQSFEEAVSLANRAVARKQLKNRIPFSGGELAGASFAIVKVDGDWVEIIQGCDAFALWALHDGTIEMTEAQNSVTEAFLNDKTVELMREIAIERGVVLEEADDGTRKEIRGEMWDRFYSILVETRYRHVNNPSSGSGYGLLNGQKELQGMWFRTTLPRSEVKTLLLFTDGMVPWRGSLEGLSTGEVARMVYKTYEEGGLVRLLARARKIEEGSRAMSYTDAAEATAIAIEF